MTDPARPDTTGLRDAPTYADGIDAAAGMAALYDTGEQAAAALGVAARLAREVAAAHPTPPEADAGAGEQDALVVAVPIPPWPCYCGWDKAHGPRCPDCGGATDLTADRTKALDAVREQAKAEALRQAADAVEDECRGQSGACFCGSSDWLRAHADRIGGQS